MSNSNWCGKDQEFKMVVEAYEEYWRNEIKDFDLKSSKMLCSAKLKGETFGGDSGSGIWLLLLKDSVISIGKQIFVPWRLKMSHSTFFSHLYQTYPGSMKHWMLFKSTMQFVLVGPVVNFLQRITSFKEIPIDCIYLSVKNFYRTDFILRKSS